MPIVGGRSALGISSSTIRLNCAIFARHIGYLRKVCARETP
jgi:hypothetical protein